LVCEHDGVHPWWLTPEDFDNFGIEYQEIYNLEDCLCLTCVAQHSQVFLDSYLIDYWKKFQKPSISGEVEHPNYYTWHPVIECYKVTQHFLGNLAQAIQYIWRCGNPTAMKGVTKEERIKDLRKAIQFIEFEIERISNDAT
jgi:hypothetical protein